MCGRFTLKTDARRIVEHFGVTEVPSVTPRYNVAPGQEIAVVKVEAGTEERVMAMHHWGLLPSWAKDPQAARQPINARAESVTERPTFREAFRRRRCLIPADGYFEWRAASGRGGVKQPFYFRRTDERVFAFAGLWEEWRRGEQTISSCAIITTTANQTVGQAHGRMPVMLREEDYALWLDPLPRDGNDEALRSLLAAPYPDELMTAYPVGTLVNNPSRDAPELIAALVAGANSA